MSKSALVLGIAGCLLGVVVGQTLLPPRLLSSWIPISTDRAAEELRAALAHRDPLQRAGELAALLPRLGPEAVPNVIAEFDQAPLNRGDVELAMLGSWWGRHDPEAAWQWTRSDWRADSNSVIAGVVRSWAQRDPRAALEHAGGLPFRGQVRVAVAAAMAGWEESGQPGLDDYVSRVGDAVLQQALGESLAERKLLTLGPEKALAWPDSLSGDFAWIMRARVASAVAESKPTIAAAWAEPRIKAAAEKGERPTGLPRRIATRWVKHDPEAAMKWLASLPAGSDRDDAVLESTRTWVRHNRIGASLWIDKLPPERWNEPARGFYARSVISRALPERALEMVSQFEDEDFRNYSTTVIARAWLQRDRAAADAWLQKANIPDDVRKRAYFVPGPAQPTPFAAGMLEGSPEPE